MRTASISLVGIVTSLLLVACATCADGNEFFVQGSTTVKVGATGAFERARTVTGAGRTFTINNPGDTFWVAQDEAFTITIPRALDLGKYALVVHDTAAPGLAHPRKRFQISLDPACRPLIDLDQQCQIINWYNPYKLPEVRVNNKSMDQIVQTPLLDERDQIIGYEIRLGNHSAGKAIDNKDNCPSPAFLLWQKMRSSNKRGTVKVAVGTRTTPYNAAYIGRNGWELTAEPQTADH